MVVVLCVVVVVLLLLLAVVVVVVVVMGGSSYLVTTSRNWCEVPSSLYEWERVSRSPPPPDGVVSPTAPLPPTLHFA